MNNKFIISEIPQETLKTTFLNEETPINAVSVCGDFKTGFFTSVKNMLLGKNEFNYIGKVVTDIIWEFVSDQEDVFIVMQSHDMFADDSKVIELVESIGTNITRIPVLYKNGKRIQDPVICFTCVNKGGLAKLFDRFWGSFLHLFICIYDNNKKSKIYNEIGLCCLNSSFTRDLLEYSTCLITESGDGDCLIFFSYVFDKKEIKDKICRVLGNSISSCNQTE